MAAKINWHRYGTQLRQCHPVYRPILCCAVSAVKWRSRKFSTGSVSIYSIPFCPFPFSCHMRRPITLRNHIPKNYVFSWQGVRTPLTPLVWLRRWCSVLKSHQCRISIRQMPSSSKFVVRTHRFEATDDVSRRNVSMGCRFRGSKCPQNLRNGYSTRKADDTDGIREGCQSLDLLLLTFKNIFWPS